MNQFTLFSMPSTQDLAQRVSTLLGCSLQSIDFREYEHGEVKLRAKNSVVNQHVCILDSIYSGPKMSIHDKLMHLLFFVASLKDAGAKSITLYLPYLCYSRKDRKTEFQDPITTRYIAQLCESVGVDCVATLESHNLSAFQNSFRCPTIHIDSTPLFVDHLATDAIFASARKKKRLVVVSPDLGGIKRNESFRRLFEKKLGFELSSAFAVKHRVDSVLSEEKLVGDVRDCDVILFDDMIVSGSTISKAAQLCLKQGAQDIFVAATHGLFTAEANKALNSPAIKKILITDSVENYEIDNKLRDEKIQVIDTSTVMAESIKSHYTDCI